MDKTWMKKNRKSIDYLCGVKDFLNFATAGASMDGKISCPCSKCVNSCSLSVEVVEAHLMQFGISQGYDSWYCHGENISATTGDTFETRDEQMELDHDSIQEMLHDAFPNVEDHSQVPNKNAQKFYDLLKDAEEPFYEGCTNYTKLSAILHLYHIKCLKGIADETFTLILQVLKLMLPSDAKLPKNYYEAKKIIKDLGLGYEKIHACPKDCMLFWKEHANDDICKCGASRWQIDETNEAKPVKKIPAKVLRWFPIKPKLQRWFMCSKTAASMKWHDEGRTKDGKMRHPADSLAWKTLDSRYPDFASDARNVRLGLATDGFNPFGNMSTSYSIWPVILVPYNLPPWMCMKRSSFMLSLLVPGPNSPTNELDVYLQPLIEELKELWEVGVETYDVSSKENFVMRASLIWTIHDFPGYGDVSGWNTKGSLACPCCNYDTQSEWLSNGGKYCYMGHRRFLDKDHRYRKDKKSFDGTQEWRDAPTMLSGIEAKLSTEDIKCEFGKTNANLKKSRIKNNGMLQPWKKQSIFFQLEYWPHLILRHMLDVMHIQANVFDNVHGTVLNLEGKTKDNLKSRLDLVDKGIRSELHPKIIGSNKTYLPPACFTMVAKEKDDFLKVLKGIKVPDGYSSNISRCIKLKQRKIGGLKSHDAHVMMQQLLPIALRGSLPKKVVLPLIELCCYFREVCSKVLQIEELERLEKKVVMTLCNLEKKFPPSFFTVMVHLVVHLAAEAKIAGPVHYRWMFPIERYLQRLKFYVRNRARPEGSIAEGYIAEECLTFCSRYIETVDTVFNRPSRNVEDASGSITNVELDQKAWTQAHRYVLFNSDEIIPFCRDHKEHIKRQARPQRISDAVVHKIHMETFVDWFRSYVGVMDNKIKDQLSDKIRWFARGPNTEVSRFKRHVVNGFKFRVNDSEETKRTQNSGVYVVAEGGRLYYGILSDIFELYYSATLRYVLFKCEWADVNSARGHKIDEYGFVLVNFSHLIHSGNRLTDEPFILASQASQVYYVKDPRDKGWLVAIRTKARDVFDVGNGEREEDDVDSYYDNEPYDFLVAGMDVDDNDNLDCSRHDAVGDTIDVLCEAQLAGHSDSDEE